MSQAAEVFARDGYLLVPGLLSGTAFRRLSEIVDRIYRAWRAENEAAVREHGMVNMHALTHARHFTDRSAERAELFDLLASEALVDLVETAAGPGIYFHDTQLFFNPADPDRRPSWHRDLQYSPLEESVQKAELGRLTSLHARIPLIPEAGLELVPGSHRRWDTEEERQVRLELEGRRSTEALPGAVLPELEPGDLLLFHAQMLHRGNYDGENRKALDLCLGTPHPHTAPFLDPENLPSAEELRRIRNPGWYERALRVAEGLPRDPNCRLGRIKTSDIR